MKSPDTSPLPVKIAKGAGRVAAAGLVGATMGFGADQGVKPVEAQGARRTATATTQTATRTAIRTPTPDAAALATKVAGLETAVAMAVPYATARSQERSEEEEKKKKEEEERQRLSGTATALTGQLKELIQNSPTTTPTPRPTLTETATSTPTVTRTPTFTPTETRTPLSPAEATVAASATNEALRLQALGRRQAEIQGQATKDAILTATARVTTPTVPPTPRPGGGSSSSGSPDVDWDNVPVVGGLITTVKTIFTGTITAAIAGALAVLFNRRARNAGGRLARRIFRRGGGP